MKTNQLFGTSAVLLALFAFTPIPNPPPVGTGGTGTRNVGTIVIGAFTPVPNPEPTSTEGGVPKTHLTTLTVLG